MPTILSHAAVPLALGLGLGVQHIPRRLLAAGVVASILPDLDVLAFRFHIAYAPWQVALACRRYARPVRQA